MTNQLSRQKSTKQWTAKQIKYQNVLGDPTDRRTDEQIATSIGVTRGTLWIWRNLPGFLDASYDQLLKNSQTYLRHVFSGLTRKAIQGDAGAARLLLEAIGKLKQQGVSTTNVVIPIMGGLSTQDQVEQLTERTNDDIRSDDGDKETTEIEKEN